MALEGLGTPDLQLAGFQLWVHGREFPEASSARAGNVLQVTAHCAAAGANVLVREASTDSLALFRFQRGLLVLYEELQGSASLGDAEASARMRTRSERNAGCAQDQYPDFVVVVSAVDRIGHLHVVVEITPEHLNQLHRFEFDQDQTHLPSVISQCASLLERYPVCNPAEWEVRAASRIRGSS